MPIVSCECGKTLKIADANIGKRFKCPNCSAILRIPGIPQKIKNGLKTASILYPHPNNNDAPFLTEKIELKDNIYIDKIRDIIKQWSANISGNPHISFEEKVEISSIYLYPCFNVICEFTVENRELCKYSSSGDELMVTQKEEDNIQIWRYGLPPALNSKSLNYQLKKTKAHEPCPRCKGVGKAHCPHCGVARVGWTGNGVV